MQDSRSRTKLFIITGLAVAFVVLPSCRRAPEEPVTEIGEKPEIELTAIDLPQQNPEIGITLNSAPSGLVATYNGESWIELTDSARQDLRYTFVAATADTTGVTPPDVGEFETMVNRMPEGAVGEGGVIETKFGSADWASGTYTQDGMLLEDVRVFVPHPSGSGALVLYSVGPKGSASIEERLATMSKLLTHVS